MAEAQIHPWASMSEGVGTGEVDKRNKWWNLEASKAYAR